MMILSIDQHKYQFLSATARVRYIDRYLLFTLFILKQFVTIGVFGSRALGNWRNVKFLFTKPEEEAWKKKKREAEEREANTIRKREEEELKRLEEELEEQEAIGGDKKGSKKDNAKSKLQKKKTFNPDKVHQFGTNGDPDKTHKVNAGKEHAKLGKKGKGSLADDLDQTFDPEFEPKEKAKNGKKKKGGKANTALMNEDVDPALKISEVKLNESLKLSSAGTDGGGKNNKGKKNKNGKKNIFGEHEDLNAIIAKGKRDKAKRRKKKLPQNLDKIDYQDDAFKTLKIQL